MRAFASRAFANRALAENVANVGLAVLGLLVTHETAYSLVTALSSLVGDHGGHVDHSHQSMVVAVIGPLALWAIAWFVLRQAKALHLTSTWSHSNLSAVVAFLYLAQESVEILVAGPSGPGALGLVENRAVVLGLILCPVVASMLLRLLHRADALVRAWLTTPESAVPATFRPMPAREIEPRAEVCHQPGNPRGPPFRDVTTSYMQFS